MNFTVRTGWPLKIFDKRKKILVIAAHPDDEVLGCGGTIAKHKRSGDEVYLLILTDGESSRPSPMLDKRAECLRASCQVLGIDNVKKLNFKDSLLDSYPILDVIREIEAYAQLVRPQVVYTHSPTDLNQDHRVAHLATLTAFRPLPDSSVELILTYEIPSSTDYGQSSSRSTFIPNYFEALSPDDVAQKMQALNCYADELRTFPHPRSLKNIEALQMVRGSSVGVESAEGFFIERLISK